jgi:DNA-binding beta-propeller fold protein YncE
MPTIKLRPAAATRTAARLARCVAGSAAVLSAAMALAAPAHGAGRVYWADAAPLPSGKISFADAGGGGGGNLATVGVPAGCCPFGTAIDAAAGRIYWGNDSVPTISFANLDGSGGGVLSTAGATATGDSLGVAIDPVAGRIYWSNAGASKISFARLDGSGGGDLSTSGANVTGPRGVAVDPAAGRVYWANNTGGATISFANLDGSVGGDLATTGASPSPSVTGVAIDTVAKRIYWANDVGNKISSAKLDGTGGGADLSVSGATVNTPFGLAIDPVAGRIYWGNYGAAKLSSAALDGSGGSDLDITGTSPVAVNFPVLLHTPAAAADPAVSGGSAVGAPLSCSPGSWAPDVIGSFFFRAPQRFAYQWSVDGTPVAGATASSLTASAPGAYRCTVTASNQAGSASQTSAPHAVAAAGPPAPPSGQTGPAVTPNLTSYTIAPISFRAATSGPSAVTKGRGATVSFRLNVAASVTFKVSRKTVGRRAAGGRCVTTTQSNRRRPTCTLSTVLGGSFVRAGVAGTNRFRFTGRLRGRTLPAGTYLLVATPTAKGRTGVARRVTFRIARPPSRRPTK